MSGVLAGLDVEVCNGGGASRGKSSLGDRPKVKKPSGAVLHLQQPPIAYLAIRGLRYPISRRGTRP